MCDRLSEELREAKETQNHTMARRVYFEMFEHRRRVKYRAKHGFRKQILGALQSVKEMDGWDLGILIRLDGWDRVFHGRSDGLPLERVMSELISEVGWLKGGEKELEERLKNLEKRGLVGHKDNDQIVYFITEKGKKMMRRNESGKKA